MSFNLVGLNLTEIFQFNWLKLHSQLHCYTVKSRSTHKCADKLCAQIMLNFIYQSVPVFIFHARITYIRLLCVFFLISILFNPTRWLFVCRVLSSRQMKLERWCAREHFHALNSQTITKIECIALHCKFWPLDMAVVYEYVNIYIWGCCIHCVY